MKRLTKENPIGDLEIALNLFFIKGEEVWVRGGGDSPDFPDVSLPRFIRKAAKTLQPDLELPQDDMELGFVMNELLFDGPDEPTGLIALLYTAAWSYAELRHKLMRYENTGLSPEQCAALAKADKEGLHERL